jgi:hypothetical protein
VKYPAKSYEKLFNSVLLNEFPEIESIEVKHGSFFKFSELDVKIHLKDYDYKKDGVVPCSVLGKDITTKMIYLTDYFGQRLVPDVKIYFQGKKICDSSD